MKISATIITLNEADNIGDACASLEWADEILVVDSGSTDETCALAREAGARVLENPWPGFARQKQFAVDNAVNDWIFSLDADERVSDELKSSIQAVKQSAALADGYRIARRSHYLGRWIRAGGWYPDWQLRLFRRNQGNWGNAVIHESVQMNPGATVAKLPGDILHYSVRDAAHHHQMIGERYAPLAAQRMFDAGRRTNAWRIATAGPMAFFQSYVLKTGFRDGVPGLSIAGFAAHHAFLKHLMLWEKQRKN
ncbi:MAG: glycosyltransferase family 2 protein [Pyrinomonadaceae bacterium]